ncbi:MAG: glycosyltransferase family 2 protein [Candidatus Spechtbacterales bacterium]
MNDPKDRYPRVSIALLNWNNADETLGCLESLKDVRYPHFDVVIVDNGSADNSVARIKEFSQKNPSLTIEVVRNSENLGFSGGCNTAITWALENGEEYLLLLNNDTEVEPFFLDELVKVASVSPKAGILVPSIFFYYEPELLWFGGDTNVAWSKMNKGITSSLFKKELPNEIHKPRELSFASGCAMLMRTDVLREVGGFDERFFLYFEDADLSFRFRKAGWDILWVPTSHIRHKVSATTLTKVGSPRIHYYDTRNVLLLSEKHGPWWMVVWRPLWAAYTFKKQVLKLLLGHQRAVSRAIADGVLDYYAGRFGKYRK